MSKRVIYSYFNNDEHRFTADYLHDEHGWDPVFFHGEERMRKWVKERYANAVFHDSSAMRQSNFDYSRLGKPVPIDAQILEALSKYELNYLVWLEDTTGWNFSIFERRRYYYDALKYWNTVIHHLKPDLFVAHTMPHLASDYPLYLLCKYYYNIPVLFFNPFPLLDGEYYNIGDSLEDLSSPFDPLYLSEDRLEVSDTVKKYLERVRSKNPQIPKHITQYWQDLDKTYRHRYMDLLRLIKMILEGRAFKKSRLAFKKNRKSWESDGSKLTNFEYSMFTRNLARTNQKLRKLYNKIARSPDLNAKYIYFPAPFQPEVLSNLYAGRYEDVFLIFDMIADVIPDDWLIYYKEHPNTFKESDKGGLMRSELFYQKICSYRNIRIIPFEFDTFQLIDNSQAVCTVGGTAGWEAVVRGKPALFYGSIWYRGCKSVFVIKTYEDALKAIKEILNGFIPDKRDVERYAEAIHRVCEHGIVDMYKFGEKIAQRADPKYEMERIAKAFYNAYEFYYGETKGRTLVQEKTMELK